MYCLMKKRMTLKMKGMNKTILVAILLIFFVGKGGAQTFRATLPIVEADGFYAIDLPVSVIGAAQSDLSDLRIFNQRDEEVAYFVKEAVSISEGHDFESYPIEINRRADQTDIRIETLNERISSFVVRVKNADTDKMGVLMGSNDGKNWYAVKDRIRLFDNYDARGTDVFLSLSFPISDYRYYLLSVNDSLSAPLNILAVGRVGSGTKHIRRLMKVPTAYYSCQLNTDKKRTEVTLAFPYAYRFEDVVFCISNPEDYDRTLSLFGKELGRLRSDAGHFQSVRCPEYVTDTLRFQIDNGDDKPLQIDSVYARIIRRFVVVQLKKNASYTLTYGDANAVHPRYDLTFRKRVPDDIPHLSVSSIERIDSPIVTSHPWMLFLKTYGVWIVIVLITIQLLYMVWRMMRKNEE